MQQKCVSLAYCAAQKKEVVVVAVPRCNSLRTVTFAREAGFRTILFAVRHLTRLVENGDRVWNGLSDTDKDHDMRDICERS